MYLVNDILTFTKDEFNEDIIVVFEPTNIREEMESVKPTFEPQCELKKIDLIYEIDE